MSPTEWPHYKKALENFLVSSQGNLTPATSSRVTKAREKLKKLTKIQFSDLSTDVYDEMKRRELHALDPSNSNLPKYLASQPNYHPKRNQARQKLAALPPSRFKDLVNDVLFEIGNRMPKEDSNKDQSTIINESNVSNMSTSNNSNFNTNINPSNNNFNTSSNKHNLTIDTSTSKQFNDDFYSDLKTPQNSDFVSSTKTNPATPSQREIKPTTLVPKKSELTWSSDEDEYENENENENAHKTHTITENDLKKISEYNEFENKNIDADAINRSPSKRETIATNEILNVHSLPHVEFPVDNDTPTNDKEKENINILKEELNDLKFKVEELQSENSKLKLENSQNGDLKLDNINMKTKLEELNRKNLEFQNLSEKYSDYDQIKNELFQVKENFANQSQELESLRELADQGHEKQLSVEDSREFDTLKTYLDKVLEENEELKSKLAEAAVTSENIIVNPEEFDDLKEKHENLTQSHASLTKDYKSLKSYSDDLADKFEQQKISLEVANKFINSKKSTTTIQANTSAVKDWQEKFEALRSNQIQTRLLSLNASQDFSNKSFFSSNGFISIENVSKLNATLETILIYLDSKDNSSKSLVDPSLLFERVANFVSIANNISKEVNISSNDKNYVRVEEKKRILKNSISNALSTTKHYALYRHVLPQLVLNASLNDVYFSTISLISIAKIRGDGTQNVSEMKQQYLEDSATVTASPIALKKVSDIEKSPISIKTKNLNKNNIENESNVKPLKITQRLASGSTLDLNDFLKPSQPTNSGTSSPMGRKILSPILPVIATPNKAENVGSPRSLSGNIRSLARQGSSDTIGNLNNVSNLNLDLKSVQIEPDTSVLSNGSSFISENPKQPYLNSDISKVSVSDLTSKFSVPTQETDNANLSKNNSPSPSRGKNIAEKLKKFDSPSGNKTNGNVNSNSNNIKDSPTSSKAKFGNGIAKAFDKFGAKRRSVEPAGAILKENFSDDSKGIATANGSTDNLYNSSKEDVNNVLTDKDLNVVVKKVSNNPFLDKSNEIKKGNLFENNDIKKNNSNVNSFNKIEENINEVDNGDELFEGDEYFNAQDVQSESLSNSKLSNAEFQQRNLSSIKDHSKDKEREVENEIQELDIPYRKTVEGKTQREQNINVGNAVPNMSISNADNSIGSIKITKDLSNLEGDPKQTDISSFDANIRENDNIHVNKDSFEDGKSIKSKTDYIESKLNSRLNSNSIIDTNSESKLGDYPSSDKSVYSGTNRDDNIKYNQNEYDESHLADKIESNIHENFNNSESDLNNYPQSNVNGNFRGNMNQHSHSEFNDNYESNINYDNDNFESNDKYESNNNFESNGKYDSNGKYESNVKYDSNDNIESTDNAESDINNDFNPEQNYQEQSKINNISSSDINEYPNSHRNDDKRLVDNNIVSNIKQYENKNLRSNEANENRFNVNPINSDSANEAQYNKNEEYVLSATDNIKTNLRDDFQSNNNGPSVSNDNSNNKSNLNDLSQSNKNIYDGINNNVESKGNVYAGSNTNHDIVYQSGSNNNDDSEEWNSASSSPFKPKVEPIKMESNLSSKSFEVNNEEKSGKFNEYEEPNKNSSQIFDDSLPSAGSALDIDEKLIRRVSRRQSYRKSLQGNSSDGGLAHNNNYNNNKTLSKQEFGNIDENGSNNVTPIREEGPIKEGWDYQGEESEDDEEEFDIDKFNTLNPDNTLRELLLYLEHQTVEVIGAIQKTLQSIRDPKATKGLLREGTDEINAVVKQMAEGTSTLMNQSRYSESMGHAKYVVGVLEDCVHRMNALYGSDKSNDSEYAGKNFKQRSAGIAFDVARSTKELVKTVEEASLRDEIAVLDSRLRRD